MEPGVKGSQALIDHVEKYRLELQSLANERPYGRLIMRGMDMLIFVAKILTPPAMAYEFLERYTVEKPLSYARQLKEAVAQKWVK